MKISIASEAPKIIFDHTQEDKLAILTFYETLKTAFSAAKRQATCKAPTTGPV